MYIGRTLIRIQRRLLLLPVCWLLLFVGRPKILSAFSMSISWPARLRPRHCFRRPPYQTIVGSNLHITNLLRDLVFLGLSLRHTSPFDRSDVETALVSSGISGSDILISSGTRV